ncbi:hypothetical protein KUCAC02_032182, partial [Chaenocephalus aceratus]
VTVYIKDRLTKSGPVAVDLPRLREEGRRRAVREDDTQAESSINTIPGDQEVVSGVLPHRRDQHQRRVDQRRVDQHRVDQRRVDQHRVDQRRVDQRRVDQRRVDQRRVDQRRVDQRRVDQRRVDQRSPTGKWNYNDEYP